MLTISIDWLAGTFKELTHEAQRFMDAYARFPSVLPDAPRHGYNSAHKDGCGTVVQWHTEYQGMGYHVQFSGSALRNIIEQKEVQPDALLRSFLNSGGRVSRLDLAKDATGEKIDLSAIYQQIERGSNRGSARTHSQIKSSGGGVTVYVGSRQSERFIRIYDKAAERELSGVLWSRFEIETKGLVARAVASTLSHTDNWAGAFDTIAKAMLDLPGSTDYQAFFDEGIVPIGLPKITKQTDREKWIETQITPAVAKHWIEHPDSEAVQGLIEVLLHIAQHRNG